MLYDMFLMGFQVFKIRFWYYTLHFDVQEVSKYKMATRRHLEKSTFELFITEQWTKCPLSVFLYVKSNSYIILNFGVSEYFNPRWSRDAILKN